MNIAIAGFAAEGKANYNYWSKQAAAITIADESESIEGVPDGIPVILGKGAFEKLQGFDLVVRTASLDPRKIKTDGKIWSATNEFFAKCQAPIIGVTGTKGKGTTSTLIAEILKAAGKTVHLVGNIGLPALQELEKIKTEHIVVFELSSFQLWDLEKSPETAVVLMIEADHQDIHGSFEDYIEAKAHIALHQGADDLLVYHPTNSSSAAIAQQSAARKKRYLTAEGAHIQDEEIIINGQSVCKVDEVGLVGRHNLENICAAITAAWKYTQNIAPMKEVITSFTGLPHRLELVRELEGVKYYNDSFSSAPGATIAAIQSFREPTILICGGHDKGGNFTELVRTIEHADNIKTVFTIGETGEALAGEIRQSAYVGDCRFVGTDFIKAIHAARGAAQPGEVVLLSPGTSSFDMFKNFYDRGEQFKKIVNAL